MPNYDYLEKDLHKCILCEWRCGIDRLSGEIGICGITIPQIASTQLHPAPPASIDAFMVGCNFRCLFCQNWPISMLKNYELDDNKTIEGYYEPEYWAEIALALLSSNEAGNIGADRLFFTGGEPTCSLPWVEAVVAAARKIIPNTKVNFDTNGYLTKDSLKRILDFTDSITFDLKAFDPKLFQALTGGNVKPVQRNLKYILKNSPEKIWEVRVMVIPGVHEDDISHLCNFISNIDPNTKLNFLAFRPNFIMEDHISADQDLMDHCLMVAKKSGLVNASSSGMIIPKRRSKNDVPKIKINLDIKNNINVPMELAHKFGCSSKHRNCGICDMKYKCPIKDYKAKKLT